MHIKQSSGLRSENIHVHYLRCAIENNGLDFFLYEDRSLGI